MMIIIVKIINNLENLIHDIHKIIHPFYHINLRENL